MDGFARYLRDARVGDSIAYKVMHEANAKPTTKDVWAYVLDWFRDNMWNEKLRVGDFLVHYMNTEDDRWNLRLKTKNV